MFISEICDYQIGLKAPTAMYSGRPYQSRQYQSRQSANSAAYTLSRGGSVGGYERSSSLSTLGVLPSGSGGGSGADGRNGSMGAWGVPPNISSDHHPSPPSSSSSQSGGYNVPSAGPGADHIPGGRGSMQGKAHLRMHRQRLLRACNSIT